MRNLKAPALAVLALVMLASGAAKAQTTADQVVDNETLKAFVEGAKAEIEAITDVNEGAKLRDRLRTEGRWKSGSMFLIIFLKSGEPFIHGNDREAESKNLIGVEDDNGLKVVEALLAAAAGGGGFVEYYDGELKTAYAVEYTSGITARQFVLVGGYSQDVSHVPIQVADHLPKPAVTASQVVDRETLITFVEEAAKVYREAVESEGYSALTGIRNAFRVEGGDWKSGSIYLWVVSGAGHHPVSRNRAVPRRQGNRPDEDGHQRGAVRRGADRRCAARGSEVLGVLLRRPDHRGRRGHRFAEARLRGGLLGGQLGPEGRHRLRHLSGRTDECCAHFVG